MVVPISTVHLFRRSARRRCRGNGCLASEGLFCCGRGAVLGAVSAAGGSGSTKPGCSCADGSALVGPIFPGLRESFTFLESGIWLLSGNQKPPYREIEKASPMAGLWGEHPSFLIGIYENAARSPLGVADAQSTFDFSHKVWYNLPVSTSGQIRLRLARD